MSIKSKSTKRLMVVVCSGVLLVGGAGGAYVLHRYQVHRHLAQDRVLGLAAAKNNDYATAIKDLGEYLDHRPADVEVLDAYVKCRPFVGAHDATQLKDLVRRYRQIETLDPNQTDARRQLMNIFASVQMWPETKIQADELLKIAPKDPQALQCLLAAKLHLRGDDLNGSKSKNIRSAMDVADEWIAADPKNPSPYLERLSLMQQTGQSNDQIMAWATKVAGANPKKPLAEVVLAAANLISDHPNKAAELLQDAAKQPMPSPEFAKTLADQLNRLHLYSASMDLLQRQAKSKNEDIAVIEALERRHWEDGQVADVVSLTDPVADKLDTQGKAIRAMALIATGKTDQAKELIAQLNKQNDPIASAWAMLLDQAENKSHTPARDLIQTCQTAIQSSPRPQPYLQYFMAEAYAQLGETELAIDSLIKVAQENQTWAQPLVRLSALELDKGRPSIAKSVAEEAWRRSGKHNAPAALALARAWTVMVESTSKSDGAAPPPELMKLVEDLHRQMPNEEQTLQLYVSLLCTSNPPRLTEAKSALNKAVSSKAEITPQSLLRLAALSRAYKLGLSGECFARAEKEGGMTSSLAYAEAIDKYADGDPAGGLTEFQQAKNKYDKKNSADWQLAEARYFELTRNPQAKQTWIALGNANPNSLMIQQTLLQTQTVQSDRDFMAKTIDRVKKLTGPEALGWRLAQARQTLSGKPSQQDLVRTSLELKQICSVAPDLSEPYALLAGCYDQLGNLPAALDQARTANEKDPNNSSIALYYSRLLQRHGDFDKSRAVLQNIASKNISPDERRQTAMLLAQQGNAQRAIDLLQKTAGPENTQDDLMLATLYRQQNRIKDVDELCTKMLAHPDGAAVEFAADFYASQGKMDQAKQTLALLDQLKLKPGMKDLVLADFASRHESLNAAIQHLKDATTAAPADPATWTGLVRAELAVGDASAAKTALEDSRKTAGSDPGLDLLRDNEDLLGSLCAIQDLRPTVLAVAQDPVKDNPALAALKQVAASSKAGDSKAQLVSALRKILDANPQSLPVRELTIRRYLEIGDQDSCQQATQLAAQGVQMFPTEIEPVQLEVQALMMSGRWNEALGYTKIWRDRAPADSLAADMAAAQADLMLHQPDDAASALAGHVATMKADPDKYADGLNIYCTALNQNGQQDKAAALIWPLAEKESAWRQRWIALALQSNIPAISADWLEKIDAQIPEKDINDRGALAEAWHALAQRTGNSQYLQTSDTMFKALISRPDVTPFTLEAMAVVQEQEKKPEEAEKYYRRALSMKKDLPISLNNLAMILARRGQDLDEAVSLAERAVAAAPNVPTIYDTLSFVQAKDKKVDAAVATIKKAIALDPRNMQWKVHEARILWDGGRHKEAQTLAVEIGAMTPPQDSSGKKTMQEWQALKAEMTKQAAANGV